MRSEQSAWCISNNSHGTDLLCALWSHALEPERGLPPVPSTEAPIVSPGVVRTDQTNADQHQGVTTMAFEAPPAEGRQCISCGDIKPLNFFGLDQQECRNCESSRRQQGIKQNANDSVEEA